MVVKRKVDRIRYTVTFYDKNRSAEFNTKKEALAYAYKHVRNYMLDNEYVSIGRNDIPLLFIGTVIKIKDKRFFYAHNVEKRAISTVYELRSDGTLVR